MKCGLPGTRSSSRSAPSLPYQWRHETAKCGSPWNPILITPIFPPLPPIYQWRHETAKCGSPWNPILITPIFQTVLTTLNYMWSVDLLRKSLAGKGRLKQL